MSVLAGLIATTLSAVAEPAAAAPLPQGDPALRMREYGVLPFIGGDTDIGLGVGLLGNVASLDPRYEPFKWRAELGAFLSSKLGADGTEKRLTFQDYYVAFVAPEILAGRLRLEIRPSFTREGTLKYYGVGNASRAPAEHVPSRDFYERTHPTLLSRARVKMAETLFVEAGASYTYNSLRVDPQSRLAADLAAGLDPLGETNPEADAHGVALFEVALMYDSRDQEIDPEAGQFHAVRLRVSPAMGEHAPYSYQGLNGTARFYLPLAQRRVTIALRTVADLLLGEAPFYELSRFDETSAIGGLRGVRGVPAQRYYGKAKLFANLEARVRAAEFSLWKKPYILGIAAFLDGGRLWSDLSPSAALDGRGVGLKYGVGAGLRVQRGKTFVVRADLAWSPDARPISGYLAAGHMF